MQRNLSARPRLLIVSDTAMWAQEDQVLAFEPVVREVEQVLPYFESIVWIGYLHSGSPALNARALSKDSPVRYVFLKAVGGFCWRQKLLALLSAPGYGLTVVREIRKANVVHTRAPSLPAFLAMCWSRLDRSRTYWHKYAGNWGEVKPPIFYNLQRLILTSLNNTIVTINGKWSSQPSHCLSFENPCITEIERQVGEIAALQKSFEGPLDVCFVGNLSHFKGITALVGAIDLLPEGMIGGLRIAGDGEARTDVEALISQHGFNNVHLLGFQSRSQLDALYRQSHILVLPSSSEGFPKVLAEAAAYGCVSLVSDVSAIGQYIIHGVNGMLLQERSPAAIATALKDLCSNRVQLKKMSDEAVKLAELFTYERFNRRILTEILHHT